MSAATADEAAIWHDVECGAYAADLPLWTGLASAAAGPVLELGAGTGRVALELAAQGLDVAAVDLSPALVAAMRERAAGRGLAVDARVADARALDLGREFAAVLAPMQFVHLLAGSQERARLLAGVGRHLRPGGMFAAALLDGEAAGAAGSGAGPPLPDVRELDGWVYSSLPVEVHREGGSIELRRLRQRVSPAGELDEQLDVTRLALLGPGELEAEAGAAGLVPLERHAIAATADHVGSVVCVLEAVR